MLVKLLAPVLFMTRAVTRLLTHGERSPVTRAEIGALVSAAVRDGTVELEQQKLFANALKIDEIKVSVCPYLTPTTLDLAKAYRDVGVEQIIVFVIAGEAGELEAQLDQLAESVVLPARDL